MQRNGGSAQLFRRNIGEPLNTIFFCFKAANSDKLEVASEK